MANQKPVVSEKLYQLLEGAYNFETGMTRWRVREYSEKSSGAVEYVTARAFWFKSIKKVLVRDSDGNAASILVVAKSGIVADQGAVWTSAS